jgi:hypothetical protein
LDKSELGDGIASLVIGTVIILGIYVFFAIVVPSVRFLAVYQGFFIFAIIEYGVGFSVCSV